MYMHMSMPMSMHMSIHMSIHMPCTSDYVVKFMMELSMRTRMRKHAEHAHPPARTCVVEFMMVLSNAMSESVVWIEMLHLSAVGWYTGGAWSKRTCVQTCVWTCV